MLPNTISISTPSQRENERQTLNAVKYTAAQCRAYAKVWMRVGAENVLYLSTSLRFEWAGATGGKVIFNVVNDNDDNVILLSASHCTHNRSSTCQTSTQMHQTVRLSRPDSSPAAASHPIPFWLRAHSDKASIYFFGCLHTARCNHKICCKQCGIKVPLCKWYSAHDINIPKTKWFYLNNMLDYYKNCVQENKTIKIS